MRQQVFAHLVNDFSERSVLGKKAPGDRASIDPEVLRNDIDSAMAARQQQFVLAARTYARGIAFTTPSFGHRWRQGT